MLVVGLVVSGCGAPEKPAPPPAAPEVEKPAPPKPELTREEKLVEGAKKEGEFQIWTNTFQREAETLKPFKEKYPFLDVTYWDI